MSDEKAELVPVEQIDHAIRVIRGQKVLLDHDLAELYGVPTKRLNEAVRRNQDRFPEDFMFQLTDEEWAILKSQSATSRSWGGRRTPPYAFTEQGVAMLSSVLSSERAVKVNIEIMRAFVRLRAILATHEELAHRLERLEHTVGDHGEGLVAVVKVLREIMAPPSGPKRRIGFRQGEDSASEAGSTLVKPN